MDEFITIEYGNGGKKYSDLISEIFRPIFCNEYLNQKSDSAICPVYGNKIAITTDSFVVKPRFFPGGDIGRLAVCGTVNDLSVSGAFPKYITVGMILESGFSVSELKRICISMEETAKEAGVFLVTGDTKVVEKGLCDGIYINTAGVGVMNRKYPSDSIVNEGDVILCSGNIAEHGFAILVAREELDFTPEIFSDVAPLNSLINCLLDAVPETVLMRDPTRGGVASVVNEWSELLQKEIILEEEKIPLSDQIRSVSELLGMDPLYMANEGKFLAVVPRKKADIALQTLRNHKMGQNAAIIGKIGSKNITRTVLNTRFGAQRILDAEQSTMLPRIC